MAVVPAAAPAAIPAVANWKVVPLLVAVTFRVLRLAIVTAKSIFKGKALEKHDMMFTLMDKR
jgi:hypothetical protein